MKRTLTIACCCAAIAIGTASPARAQSVIEASGGWTTPLSDIRSTLSTGWDVDFAAGRQFSGWFSLLGEFGYSVMPVKQSVLLQLQAPNGRGQILTLGIEPEVRFPVSKTLHGFIAGGVDLVHRNVKLTSPSVQTVDTSIGIQDITILNVISDVSRTGIGEHFGAGVAYPIAAIGADLFVQIRYFRASTPPEATAMLPVMFGLRWTGQH
ncbi:MAG TPA: hypothetical protein VHZ73_07940 [Vicinamibacterales bacterium]|jgi:hypothetical protein|nr:hypothetical protein [Vicinamibacterales bacterium]